MKIYIKNQQQEYVDVSFWSIIKAHFFSSLFFGLITYIIVTILTNIAYNI